MVELGAADAAPQPEVPAAAASVVERLLANIETVVLGKSDTVKLVLTAFACRGHVLLEDVPGTAKTVLARALAASIRGAATSRIQCTPDLQPTDVTGLSIWNPEPRRFEFQRGPIFANILLVDEINRALPKAQSALLEGMAEQRVTVDGATHALPDPFFVIATENALEQAGTFPLPEAQLDRFFLRTSLGYPTLADELRILDDQLHGHPLHDLVAVVEQSELEALFTAVEDVYFDPLLKQWAVELVRATRALDLVALGASVRGSLSLERAARAWALIDGRGYVLPADIETLFLPVIAHRLVLTPEATLELDDQSAAAIGPAVWAACLAAAPRPEPDWESPPSADGRNVDR